MKRILHNWFGIGSHTFKRATGNQSRDLKYCDCGEMRTIKRRSRVEAIVADPQIQASLKRMAKK